MSVLIKGFEVPKDGCKDCAMVQRGRIFDTCPFLGKEVNGNVERGGKPNGCPLIDVTDTNVGDLISRAEALDAMLKAGTRDGAEWAVRILPSAQPEITLESAIDYLHSIGWMQEHDRVLTESAQRDLSGYSDKLWKAAYERGKAEAEQRGILWEKLERYAEFFCADVPYTEFVREAKQFFLDAERSEE